ncbi:MAG TPA: DegT/DnrJ/EryC1/StrS family aminotransferase, partial [Magnetospirillaceae bacterium]|nr:DegT/DnrJ/EryC1/StrS family aminotransferase [Magnetospirillaceae bacterium]
RSLRQYGWTDQPISQIPGCNSRLDEMQAAILRVRLNHLEEDNGRRQAIAAAYDEALTGLSAKAPMRRAGSTHVFHQYVIELAERDRVRAALAERGVKTLIHYPVPAHLQPAYRGRLPIAPAGLGKTEHFAKNILSLPLYPHLPDEARRHVVASLVEILG